jgi:elongation factor Ts
MLRRSIDIHFHLRKLIMEITASAVKELRERSGAGMMECKKALTQNNGNMEAAVDWLRTQGLAKADKKATRVTAEGRMAFASNSQCAVIVELNCETDFVAKDENFVAFSNAVAQAALAAKTADLEAIKNLSIDGETVENRRQALVAKIGENMQIRRAVLVEGSTLGSYLHGTRIGVVVSLNGGDVELARGIAMHVAALQPQYLTMTDVPAEAYEREKQIAIDQAKDSGKPADIIAKMVEGKIRKTLGEQTLLGQVYAGPTGDNATTVEALLKQAKASVVSFVRYAVGEGIEKKQEDFAAEVMAQVAASQKA